jgi:hypothetical protein
MSRWGSIVVSLVRPQTRVLSLTGGDGRGLFMVWFCSRIWYRRSVFPNRKSKLGNSFCIRRDFRVPCAGASFLGACYSVLPGSGIFMSLSWCLTMAQKTWECFIRSKTHRNFVLCGCIWHPCDLEAGPTVSTPQTNRLHQLQDANECEQSVAGCD